jgi:hypothetical protein
MIAEARHRAGLAIYSPETCIIEAIRLDDRDRHVPAESRVTRRVHDLAGALSE